MKYQEIDILNFLKSQYEFQVVFDPVVLKGEQLKYETPIWEWIDICDLIEPQELAKVYNEEFEIIDGSNELENLLKSKNSTIREFCEYISNHAEKQEVKPIKILGSNCQTASIFKTLMSNLKKKGIDTDNIKPSNKLNPIFLLDAGMFANEVNKITPGVITNYEYKENQIVKLGNGLIISGLLIPIIGSIIWKFNFLLFIPFLVGIMVYKNGNKKGPEVLEIDELITFRDLINKMNEQMVKAST